jgi:hypothetical protein
VPRTALEGGVSGAVCGPTATSAAGDESDRRAGVAGPRIVHGGCMVSPGAGSQEACSAAKIVTTPVSARDVVGGRRPLCRRVAAAVAPVAPMTAIVRSSGCHCVSRHAGPGDPRQTPVASPRLASPRLASTSAVDTDRRTPGFRMSSVLFRAATTRSPALRPSRQPRF